MPISGSKAVGRSVTDSAVNTNASSTTTAIHMHDAKHMSLFVVDNSGTHATHVITVQISGDGTNWEDTSLTITGTGKISGALCIAVFVRAKVTTLEGGTSTVDITLVIK